MPHGSCQEKGHAAEFGQADLLDAESEVIRFILRFFGSVNKVLPLLKDLADGNKGARSRARSRQGKADRATASPAAPSILAGSHDASLGLNTENLAVEPEGNITEGQNFRSGMLLPTVLESDAAEEEVAEPGEPSVPVEPPDAA
eukprot:7652245-Alexandrium_andersonii.AAC.1